MLVVERWRAGLPWEPLGSGGGPIGSRRGKGQCRSVSRWPNAGLFERENNFVGADEPEVAADQFVGHVGIGLARVEQGRAVPELRAGRLELRQFGLTELEVAMITAPGEQPVGTRDGVTGEV